MVVSTLAALASAGLFAVTTNLQRAAASSVPVEGTGPMHLVRRLLTDRRWLAGGLIGGAALGLHAVALAGGTIMVVQSVMALGLVIALTVEARREGRRLHRHELGGAALVVIGVATMISVSRPPDVAQARSWPAALAGALVALAAAGAVLRSRHSVGARWEARVLAAAGGACFAVDAVFLQRLTSLLDDALDGGGLGAVLGVAAVVDVIGFFGASAVGTVAIHRAYQVAPLRAVQPALAAAEPVTAFAVGVVVLHEGVRGGVPGFAVLVAGLAAIVAGIFVGLLPALATRPALGDVVGAGGPGARQGSARPAPRPAMPRPAMPRPAMPLPAMPRPAAARRPVPLVLSVRPSGSSAHARAAEGRPAPDAPARVWISPPKAVPVGLRTR